MNVLTHTRTDAMGGAYQPITLPAAPWEQGRPHQPPRPKTPPQRPAQALRERMVAAMPGRWWTVREMSTAMGARESTVRDRMGKLIKEGRVERRACDRDGARTEYRLL